MTYLVVGAFAFAAGWWACTFYVIARLRPVDPEDSRAGMSWKDRG